MPVSRAVLIWIVSLFCNPNLAALLQKLSYKISLAHRQCGKTSFLLHRGDIRIDNKFMSLMTDIFLYSSLCPHLTHPDTHKPVISPASLFFISSINDKHNSPIVARGRGAPPKLQRGCVAINNPVTVFLGGFFISDFSCETCWAEGRGSLWAGGGEREEKSLGVSQAKWKEIQIFQLICLAPLWADVG